MKPKYWAKGSIFATFFVCCIITVLLCSALATDYWIVSSVKQQNRTSTTSVGNINFGLFNGKKVLDYGLGDRTYDIKVVCLKNESVCVYSCGSTPEERLADLEDLIYTNASQWDEKDKCRGKDDVSGVGAAQVPAGSPLGLHLWPRVSTLDGLLRPSTQELDVDDVGAYVTKIYQTEPKFMVYGLWLSTIVMMGIAIAFVVVAAMFAILNTATNPVEALTGVVGLYIWNGIAAFFEILALVLWGVQFHKRLRHSVLWRNEMNNGWSTEGLASLGYSYWLVFVALVLHGVNMAILWFGTHQKRPKKVQIPVERGNTNAVNMIY